VASGRVAEAVPRAVEGAHAGRAEGEAAVAAAAQPLLLHRVALGRVLAAGAGLQALVAEQGLGDLAGRDTTGRFTPFSRFRSFWFL